MIFLNALLALAALLLPAPALAATFAVTKTADTADGACTADCSLREAVIAANANPGADAIALPAGTFTLTRVGDGDASIGDLDVTGPVAIGGVSAAQTIVDANGAITNDRAFSFQSAGVVSLSNLTVRNGRADTGGCVKSAASTLAMTDAVVTGCAATGAGGGGLHNLQGGSLTLTRCTVSDNASEGFGSEGGGLLNEGAQAAALIANTQATVRDSLFVGNRTQGIGGAIANATGFELGSPPAILIVENGTIAANSASAQAGGVSNFPGGEMSLVNVTVADNFYTGPGAVGGGVLSNGETDRLVNCTVARNGNDEQGMPTGNPWAQIIGTPEIANTLIVGNGDPSCIESFPPRSLGGNVAPDASCGLTEPSDAEAVADARVAADLADNGGPTRTLALLAASPALARGLPAYCPDADQRGAARAAACDAGAFQRCPSDLPAVLALLQAALAAAPESAVDWVPCLRGVGGP